MILCVRPSLTAVCHYSHIPTFLEFNLHPCPLVSLLPFACLVFTEAVHHVSVSINVSHSSLICGEAWGTDPHFSWLYEKVAISQAVGTVSGDGTTLFVTMKPFCGHFTCIVSNKLGHSSASFSAAPCETEGRGTTAAVVCLVLLLLLVGGVLAFLLWRRHRQSSRGQWLHEHLDETI